MQRNTLKSLSKGLNILKLFTYSKEELSLTEISQLLELNKPTAFRLIATLIELGFLKKQEKKGKYFLGPMFYNFTKVINSGIPLRNIAAPYLLQLSHQVDEVTNLALENGIGNTYTEAFFNCTRPNPLFNINPSIDGSMPLYATSLGKIILAYMPEEKLRRYLRTHKFERNAPNTITDVTVLKDHLNIIKKEGVSFDNEEFYPGLRSIGTGITDGGTEVVGAIGIIAPSVRFTHSRMQELVQEIKSCAAEISQDIFITMNGPNNLKSK